MPKHFRLILFCLCFPLLAQTPVQITNPCIQNGCYVATTSTTLGASASTTLTVQQKASGARAVQFSAAVVQCPGQSFTVDQSQNGTAATATTGSAVALTPTTTAAAATVWTASNVGAGTATAPTLSFVSGPPAVIDLSQRNMNTSGTAVNYSLKLTNTGSASCTASIAIYFQENI
ncbi:MAG: hypothetical protein KGL39_16965 [Patescibacteria group bacterium]|nr:hypothetical protein [Patescibacteria group bacterium]